MHLQIGFLTRFGCKSTHYFLMCMKKKEKSGQGKAIIDYFASFLWLWSMTGSRLYSSTPTSASSKSQPAQRCDFRDLTRQCQLQ